MTNLNPAFSLKTEVSDPLCFWLDETDMSLVHHVGGKNASLVRIHTVQQMSGSAVAHTVIHMQDFLVT
jgi:hypothetical protein